MEHLSFLQQIKLEILFLFYVYGCVVHMWDYVSLVWPLPVAGRAVYWIPWHWS